jgi:N-acetylmuramoyl-L-alanine amidase
VTVPALNVRSGPNKNDSIVTVAKRGTDVAIIAKSNGWYKVQLPDGTIGWVVAYGIGLANTAPAPTTTAASKVTSGATKQPTRTGYPTAATNHAMTTITVGGLRVHSKSSLSAPVITSLTKGQKVIVLSRGTRWTKIQLADGQVGWIFTQYTSAATASRTTTASASKTAYNAPATTVKKATSTTQGKSTLTAGVNVRVAPSVSARVVTTAIAGTHVAVLGRSGAWDRIRLPNGQTGYVYATYVRA